MALKAEIWAGVRHSALLELVSGHARESMEKSHWRGFSMSRSVTPSMLSQASRTALVVKLRMDWVRFLADVCLMC